MFLPITKLASIHTILMLAACHDWDMDTFNFNSTYLNSELGEEEEIYMQEPPGFEESTGSVTWLRKSLYRLKQARRQWYDTLTCTLNNLGLCITQANLGVFCAQVEDDVLILAVHVNNCVIMSSSSKLMCHYKQTFNARYALTDLGPIHWLLRI